MSRPVDPAGTWDVDWPPVGVHREPAPASAGVDALAAEGFRAIFAVDPIDGDRDVFLDHLNNGAAVRMFNEVRVAYTARHHAPDWPRHVRRMGGMVVVRELHVRYDREGMIHERFVAGMRIVQRRGRAAVVDQALVEADSGASVARAWVVMLHLDATGAVIDFPDLYWDLVAGVEGGPVPVYQAATRVPWGPPVD